jgi:hypothetical protein
MRTLIVAVSIVILLVGCTTTAERAAKMEQEAVTMIQVYGPACEKLGFTVNTDSWRNCLIDLSRQEPVRYSSPYYYGSPFYYGPTIYYGPSFMHFPHRLR